VPTATSRCMGPSPFVRDDGSLLIAGAKNGAGFVARFDASMNLSWGQYYPGSLRIQSIRPGSGGWILASMQGNGRAALINVNASGESSGSCPATSDDAGAGQAQGGSFTFDGSSIKRDMRDVPAGAVVMPLDWTLNCSTSGSIATCQIATQNGFASSFEWGAPVNKPSSCSSSYSGYSGKILVGANSTASFSFDLSCVPVQISNGSDPWTKTVTASAAPSNQFTVTTPTRYFEDAATVTVTPLCSGPPPLPPPVFSSVTLNPNDYVNEALTGVSAGRILTASGSQNAIGIAADGVSAVLVRISTTRYADLSLQLSGAPASSTCQLATLGSAGQWAGCATTMAAHQLLPDPAGTGRWFGIVAVSAGEGSDWVGRTLIVKWNQGEYSGSSGPIGIYAPPVATIHGIWSNGSAWASFNRYARTQIVRGPAGATAPPPIPHDYEKLHSAAFDGAATIERFRIRLRTSLLSYNRLGISAAQVDVVAHSMGGVVVRAFAREESTAADSGRLKPSFLTKGEGPIHRLVAVGTPHQGTPLADYLLAQANATLVPTTDVGVLCSHFAPCLAAALAGSVSLAAYLQVADMSITEGAADSLRDGSGGVPNLHITELPTFPRTAGVIGVAPVGSSAESNLNRILGAFRLKPLASVFNGDHDTIVPATSQRGGSPRASTQINGIVHASVPLSRDETETTSLGVFETVKCYLAQNWRVAAPVVACASASSASTSLSLDSLSQTTLQAIDFSTMTEVDPMNVTITPGASTPLRVGDATTISATSSTKIISSLVFWTGSSFVDVTQAPFSIQVTPETLEDFHVTWVAVFTDGTYASASTTFKVVASCTFNALSGGPALWLLQGERTTLNLSATCVSAGAMIEIKSGASYVSQSGTAAVISVTARGEVTAQGPGDDVIVLTYAGLTTTVPVHVTAAPQPFPRGDANGDRTVTVSDVFYDVNALFASGPAPASGDANGDGQFSAADVFYLVNYLLAGGPPPPL